MSNPFGESIEPTPDPSERPAPGGPNDPGASASDENQADTPGYSGGGDGDPTTEGPELRPVDDEALLDDPEAIDEPEDPADGDLL
jgi:hypothetical protein